MKNRTTLWLLVLILLLYALDQASKWYIVTHFNMPIFVFMDGVPVLKDNGILHFSIIRIHNTGVAFGLGNGTTWAPYVFLSVQLVALVGLIMLYRRGFFSTRLLRLAWACVLAGVLGNMTDRLVQGFFLPGVEEFSFFHKLRLGYVVDFLDFSFPWLPMEGFPHGYHWPAFNVADSCVCIAASLFVISAFFFPPKQEETKQPAAADTPDA